MGDSLYPGQELTISEDLCTVGRYSAYSRPVSWLADISSNAFPNQIVSGRIPGGIRIRTTPLQWRDRTGFSPVSHFIGRKAKQAAETLNTGIIIRSNNWNVNAPGQTIPLNE